MSENETTNNNIWIPRLLIFVFPLIVLCYLVYLFIFGPPQADRLQHFVPQTDRAGEVKLNAAGDTIWHSIPDFTFVNQNGKQVSDTILDDKITVVDYFFTTCPSICIAMSNNLTKVQKVFSEDEDVRILSHTVDPETDDPATLLAYAERYEANPKIWTFVTGKKEELYDQARYGYFIPAPLPSDGEEDFVHSERFILIDKNRNIRGFYDGTDTLEVTRMIEEIQVLQLEYGTHKKYR